LKCVIIFSAKKAGFDKEPGFETNDIGYLRQADQTMHYVWIGYRINNPVSIFRNVNINLNGWQGWNFGGDRLFMGSNLNGGAQFLNYWGFRAGVNRRGTGLSSWYLRGGPMLKYQGSWNNFFRIYSDNRKALQFETETFMNSSDDGISKRVQSNISMFYKVNDKVNVRFEPFYERRIENLQYIDTQEMNDEDRYVFGHLKQNTFGMVFRLNYSLTPDLSIQYFGQPFVSAGNYSKFKQITRPKASGRDRYEMYAENQVSYDTDEETYFIDEDLDGSSDYSFEQPDFNYKQFLSNLVVRWEYMPGSTLYLVWSQSRTGYDEMGKFSLNNDMQNLFDTVPNNVWLIKMNYWFSL